MSIAALRSVTKTVFSVLSIERLLSKNKIANGDFSLVFHKKKPFFSCGSSFRAAIPNSDFPRAEKDKSPIFAFKTALLSADCEKAVLSEKGIGHFKRAFPVFFDSKKNVFQKGFSPKSWIAYAKDGLVPQKDRSRELFYQRGGMLFFL
jgi:hypothetical protein